MTRDSDPKLDVSPQSPAEKKEEWQLVPPDGGWGWLVLGGTLLINMLIPGTIKSFGVLFVEFKEVFHSTDAEAAWIPALCYFLYCSLGPLTAWLSMKTSYRAVTIAGGLSAAFGYIISCFATSIPYLYVSFGVLVGLGAGLSFPPGIYLVTSYFVKYRGLANGLAISGSAIGSIIFPPFINFLLQYYGYRGAVLILGGMTFNVIVAALLYDPVSMHMKKVRVVKDLENGDVATTDDKPTVEVTEDSDKSTELALVSKPPGKSEKESEQPLLIEHSGRKLSAGFRKSNVNLENYNIVRKVSSSSYAGRMHNVGSASQINRKISAHASPFIGSTGHMPRNYSVASNMSSSSFRYVSTAFHGSTLVNLHHDFSSNQAIKKEEKSFFSCLPCCRSKDKKSTSEKEKKDGGVLELLKNPIYIIVLISNATNAIGYVNFTIIAPSYAISLGFDRNKAAYLLSIISTTDLIGRIGGAALSDFLKLDKKVYFIGGFLVSGISLAILPLFTNYTIMGAVCAMFGLASGTYVGITAVVMVDILGEEKLASSYGISLFVNGVLQLIGPPIIGLIVERVHSFKLIVTGLGLTLIFGAAVWLAAPFFDKKKKDSN
uniref:Monocarboxylate transporter 12 n=1 Tax=Lygus hesperus TaxID=30085 RepID=A0A146KNZ0_LYGHE